MHQPREPNSEIRTRSSCERRAAADSLSYAPRGLSREEAARYIGVGATKFDEMVKDGRMPRPKRIDGRVVWDRIKLEAAFSDLPEERESNPLDKMLLATR
jgi:excisionase family DNA binding protein